MQKIPLLYQENSSTLFEKLIDLPWPVFLDSNQPHSYQGRYDILTAAPSVRIETLAGETRVNDEVMSERDPIAILEQLLPLSRVESSFPFIGGAIGYFAYDLAPYYERLPETARKVIDIPELMVGIYDWAIVVDHQEQSTTLVSHHRYPQTAELIESLLSRIQKSRTQELLRDFSLRTAWQSNMSKDDYSKAFQAIQTYIRNGDCYQVNLAQTFSAEYQGNPWIAYQRLRAANPVPYGAYLHYPRFDILSLSPERFLQVFDQQVMTKPIKGTRRRSKDPQEDEALKIELLQSEKDHAENVMIVDLLRNDLGKICEVGSIKVPKLCELETFPTVHHLVSTVTGKLRAPEEVFRLLKGAFPGGSITGAPKIRAMEIIDELEPTRRGLYCGSIGYIDYRGHIDTNIAIRTVTAVANQLFCSAGGALVSDSSVDDEYQETFDKVNVLLRALS